MAESGQRYDLLEPIASGGMGDVFRAEVRGEHGFRRAVAVKRIRADLARSPEFLMRFVAEAKTTCALVHANVVQVIDLCRAGDELLIVMELVDGVDLGALMNLQFERRALMPVGMAIHIGIETLKALVYAHERGGVGRGIVHCDISPSNLLVSFAGEVKVTDFGIAQSLSRSRGRPTAVMGKLRYMAPEQANGLGVDERTDLYSLGIVLYEALTLRPLFRGEGPLDENAVLQRVLHEVPTRLDELRDDVPSALAELVASALAKNPRDRPRRARDMLHALSRVAFDSGVLVTAPDVGQWVTELDAAGEVKKRTVALTASMQVAQGTVSMPIAFDPANGTVSNRPRFDRPRTLTFSGQTSDEGLAILDELAPGDSELVPAPPPASRRGVWLAIAAGFLVALGVTGATIGTRRRSAAPQPAVVIEKPEQSLAATDAATPAPVAPTRPTTEVAAAPTRVEHKPVGKTKPPPVRPTSVDGSHTGALNIYAEPWANATLDGKSIGTTPIVGLMVPAGDHKLRLTNPGTKPFERRVTVPAGGRELVSVELTPAQ